jgi:hypothetical protein
MDSKEKEKGIERISELSELSMLLLVCQQAPAPVGALKNRLNRLEKVVISEISKYGEIGIVEMCKMHFLISLFSERSKWSAGQDLKAWISFTIGISDKWPSVLSILDEIQKYFDRANKQDGELEDMGADALELWQTLSVSDEVLSAMELC